MGEGEGTTGDGDGATGEGEGLGLGVGCPSSNGLVSSSPAVNGLFPCCCCAGDGEGDGLGGLVGLQAQRQQQHGASALVLLGLRATLVTWAQRTLSQQRKRAVQQKEEREQQFKCGGLLYDRGSATARISHGAAATPRPSSLTHTPTRCLAGSGTQTSATWRCLGRGRRTPHSQRAACRPAGPRRPPAQSCSRQMTMESSGEGPRSAGSHSTLHGHCSSAAVAEEPAQLLLAALAARHGLPPSKQPRQHGDSHVGGGGVALAGHRAVQRVLHRGDDPLGLGAGRQHHLALGGRHHRVCGGEVPGGCRAQVQAWLDGRTAACLCGGTEQRLCMLQTCRAACTADSTRGVWAGAGPQPTYKEHRL